jgi:hypothetical protein
MSETSPSRGGEPVRLCKYPACNRPAEPAPEGGGRPPAYCDRADHTAHTAFRARQQAHTAGEGEARPAAP